MVGTDVSIVVEKDPLADQFPAESRSWTYRVWVPSSRFNSGVYEVDSVSIHSPASVFI